MCWYWKYLKYVLLHKWYVFVEAMKLGLVWHAMTHDLSKFSRAEFVPYALWFNSTLGCKYDPDDEYHGELKIIADKKHYNLEDRFNSAWNHHQKKNKHHWDYWVTATGTPVIMPGKYIMQMIIDWEAMGKTKTYGDTAELYYKRCSDKMKLHPSTIDLLDDYFTWGIRPDMVLSGRECLHTSNKYIDRN